ncbi:hypothetical protein PMAYCL1PPCAC_03461, partial [Pristionchus mayeri]
MQVTSPETAQRNSITARLAGFDNVLDENEDGCPYAYKTPDSPNFPGFFLSVTTPLLSFAIEQPAGIQIQTTQLLSLGSRDIGSAGFITPDGWNGCKKPKTGGIQSFRSTGSVYNPPTFTILQPENDSYYNVSLEVLPHFTAKRNLTFSELSSLDNPTIVTGIDQQNFEFYGIRYLDFEYKNMEGCQGFLVRHSSIVLPKTSLAPTTTTTTT